MKIKILEPDLSPVIVTMEKVVNKPHDKHIIYEYNGIGHSIQSFNLKRYINLERMFFKIEEGDGKILRDLIELLTDKMYDNNTVLKMTFEQYLFF